MIRKSAQPYHLKSKDNKNPFSTNFAIGLTIICFCTLVSLFAYQVIGTNNLKVSINLKNPEMVARVLSGKETTANAAWWGFDKEDSTDSLQAAINSGTGKVIVPYMGSDWIVRPIKLTSNQEIVFEPGVIVTAKKGEFQHKNHCLLSANGKKNITLSGYGATLRMRKNDYTKPPYPRSEWRMAIAFYCCSDIKVSGLTLKDSGGDGIFLGALKKGVPCRNVVIRDCIFDNNYRQGMSVISVENLLVENCVFKNTNGTPPSAGIDIEPDVETDSLVNVVISNCVSQDNAGSGLTVYLNKLKRKSKNVSILFVNCYVSRCGKSGMIVGAVNDDGPKGLIEFKNCTVEDLNSPGVYIFDKSPDSALLRFDNCKLSNVAKIKTTTYLDNNVNSSPIHFFLRREKFARRFGGVEFVDCSVHDDKERPFLTATERGKGLYDIVGNIDVYNRFGAKMDLGGKTKTIALRVNEHVAETQRP
jgi:polygalacturonase